MRSAWAALLGLLASLSHGLAQSSSPPDRPRPRSNKDAVELARLAVRRAQAQPEVARSWVERLRRAAWLPELRAGAEKDLGTRETIDPLDRTRYGAYAVDRFQLDVRATWRLDRLLFDPEELRASRESVRLAELRQALSLLVVRLFFERRRLEVEARLDANAPPRDQALRQARIEEISATLDALCGVQ